MVRAYGRRLGGNHDHSEEAKGGSRLSPSVLEVDSDGTVKLPSQF